MAMTLLITGATGAVGSAAAALFLQQPEARVRLLLRAKDEPHRQQRLQELLDFWQLPAELTAPPGRLIALCGDVSKPRLGLDHAVYEQLARELTHVIHCAANIKMNLSLEEARRVSVTSAREVIALVEHCKEVGHPCKLEYVSTLGVAGKMSGLIPEQPLNIPRQFHNTYESSKAEAERLVSEKMAAGLSATIHRPSMVVGAAETGKIIHFQIFYYLCEFLTGRSTFGFIPQVGNFRLDTVPVDFVANTLLWSSRASASGGHILHHSAGPEQAMPLAELIERLRDSPLARHQALPPLRRLPVGLFRASLPLLKAASPPKARRAIGNLRFFLEYLADDQRFDNRNTLTLLQGTGLSPTPLAEMLDNILDYYAKITKTSSTR